MARLPRATLFLLTITANAAFFGRQRRKPDVPPGGLACDDGYTAVPSSYINDDYCDCADGADEPPAGKTRTRAAFLSSSPSMPTNSQREHANIGRYSGFCSIMALNRRHGPVTALSAGLANL